MTNIIAEIREHVTDCVKKALDKAICAGELPEIEIGEITIETPKEKEHGDLSTNIAMQMARQAKMAPAKIASLLIANMDFNGTFIEKAECAGPGFLNFFLKKEWLFEAVRRIIREKEDYGRINIGHGRKVMVEYVSANPTGPLHMGNARGGALGDLIASVLEAAGYDVTREFYVNDAGNQIEKFGISLEARYLQLLKGEDAVEFPEDGYHGEDIIDHAREYIEQYGDKLLSEEPEMRRKKLVEYALPKNLERIKKGLESYGVVHDVWFSEQSLYDSGEFDETLKILRDNNLTYMKDGAEWLKTSMFGEEKDVVLIRNNGVPTYFASDIAYHRNKFITRGFDWVINLWGADHHGHVGRMKAAMKALGIDPDKLDLVVFQLVRLIKDGQVARMSKRTGRAITLDDLIEEVGRDAVRFIFNTKTSGSHLDFDLDLAVKQSNENPVYYVQYAHARICSMLRLIESEGVKVPQPDQVDFTKLRAPEELDLMRKLAEYPDEIRISAQTLEPSRLTRYVTDVASLFHSFYNACRVKGEEEELMKARLLLVESTRIVIKNVLDILKISAPEKM